jgi:hypothetical protein
MNDPIEQERIIQKAVQDYYDRIEIPDETEPWQKIRVRLQKRRQFVITT